MAGNDLSTMTDDVRNILTAPEIVAIDQDPAGQQGRRILRDGDVDVWLRRIGANGERAIAVLNRGAVAREVRIAFEDLGVAAGAHVRVLDPLQRTDVGGSRRGIAIPPTPVCATVSGVPPPVPRPTEGPPLPPPRAGRA